jgi:hypothetical protein
MSEFIKPMKSTIDQLGVAIGANYMAGDIAVIDLTDNVNVEELLASPDPAIVWELGTMNPAPREPMWDVSFVIGAKTAKDPARYEQMSLIEAVNAAVKQGSDIQVRDYSGETAGAIVGYLHITWVGLDPAQGDRFSGVRLVSVRGKAVSY